MNTIERGESLFAQGNVEEAEKCFLSALERDPENQEILNDLGVISFVKRNLVTASEYFLTALAIQDESPDAIKNLLDLYQTTRGWEKIPMELQGTESGIELLEKAISLLPNDAGIRNDLGLILFKKGRLEKAEKALKRALELNPGYSAALYNLGRVYRKQGRMAEAMEKMDKCLSVDPNFQKGKVWKIDHADREELSQLIRDLQIRIKVLSPSEFDQDRERQVMWGDHWVKVEMEQAFEELGFRVVQKDADVLLYFFGSPIQNLPRNTLNLVWVYSHPDSITSENLRIFDHVFCLSPSYAEKLKTMGYPSVETIIGATSKTPKKIETKYDIVFVGNIRNEKGRPIISDLGEVPYNFKVWGNGWDQILPEKYYGGRYIDYRQLDELYASSRITVNDHHHDMAREGFVAVKVFDILASGGFVISDENRGLEAIFGDAVPQYTSPAHLRELVDYYMVNEKERRHLMKKGRKIALSHTYAERADQMARTILKRLNGRVIPKDVSSKASAYSGERRPRVLYVDTLSAPNAACNVNGMLKAYQKASEVIPFDYRGLAQKYGTNRMNQLLFQKALEVKPDMLHLGKSECIAGATIKAIKEHLDTFVVHFYGDFRWEPQPWVVDIGRYADCTLFNHTDDRILDKYRKAGVERIGGWWDSGSDPEIFYPRNVAKDKDVVFMGNNLDLPHDGYDKRRRLIEGLLKKKIHVHVYGENWEYLQEAGHKTLHIRPFVTEDVFAEVCSRAKITLGINGVNNIRMYASWRRTVNTMACGAFHLTHYVPGMERLFENEKHLVWFQSIPEALELVDYYLKHEDERQTICQAGRQEILAKHTWDARIGEMIGRYKKTKNQTIKHLFGEKRKRNKNSESKPVVSVIMPTFNRASIIERSIQSLLNQTLTNFELIIFDDASTDNTAEVVQNIGDPRIRYIKRTINHLQFYNDAKVIDNPRNDGLKVANGTYVSYLDSDDVYRPVFLEKMSIYLDQHPDIGFVYCDSIWHRNLDGNQELATCNMSFDFDRKLMEQRNLIGPLTVMHRFDIVRKIGLFKPINVRCPHSGVPYVGIEDWDYWLRISGCYPIKHLPYIWADKIHESSSGYWDKTFLSESNMSS